MNLINAIGSVFKKLTNGWTFGLPNRTVTLKDNTIIQIDILGDVDTEYDYQFQQKSGTVAHLDDIPSIDDLEPAFVKGNVVQGAGVNLLGSLLERLVGAGNITISHADTSSQVDIINTEGTIIQSFQLDDFGHIVSASSLNGDNRWARLIEVLSSQSLWSHVALQNGIDFTPYTTGSSGYPSSLGFAVAFYANTSDSTSGFGRTFALNRAYNSENYYIGSPNTSGVHNGWRLIYHSGNLTISTLGGEPALGTGTTTQYLRGDKTWQELDHNLATTNKQGGDGTNFYHLGQTNYNDVIAALSERIVTDKTNRRVPTATNFDFQSASGFVLTNTWSQVEYVNDWYIFLASAFSSTDTTKLGFRTKDFLTIEEIPDIMGSSFPDCLVFTGTALLNGSRRTSDPTTVYITKSTDNGLTWAPVTVPFDWATIRSMYHSNGRTIVVGSGGTGPKICYTDNDGDTWNFANVDASKNWSALCSNGNGVWVAGSSISGSSGNTAYSLDNGVNWTVITGGLSSPERIIYVKNKFISIVTGGVLISGDGISWNNYGSETIRLADGELGIGTALSEIFSFNDNSFFCLRNISTSTDILNGRMLLTSSDLRNWARNRFPVLLFATAKTVNNISFCLGKNGIYYSGKLNVFPSNEESNTANLIAGENIEFEGGDGVGVLFGNQNLTIKSTGGGSKNVDGGTWDTVYLPSQNINGGTL